MIIVEVTGARIHIAQFELKSELKSDEKKVQILSMISMLVNKRTTPCNAAKCRVWAWHSCRSQVDMAIVNLAAS